MPERFYSLFVKSEHRRSVFAMLLGSSLIALGPFFVEFSLVSAETNTFYRLLLGALFFISFTFFKKELTVNPKFLAISALGGSLLVLDLFLWNQSVLYLGAGLSTVLSNIEIFFLVFIGKIYFSEKTPAKFFILCIFIAIGIGALLFPIIPELTWTSLVGIILALGASFSYALYLFSIKYISKKFPEQTSTGTLAVICLTGCLLLGGIIFTHDIKMFIIPSWHSIICILANSVLSQIIAWWFISKAIVRLSLSLSGLLLLMQPALTFFLDCLFLSRNTHWLQLTGSICLLGSVYMASQNQQLQKELHESNHSNRG